MTNEDKVNKIQQADENTKQQDTSNTEASDVIGEMIGLGCETVSFVADAAAFTGECGIALGKGVLAVGEGIVTVTGAVLEGIFS